MAKKKKSNSSYSNITIKPKNYKKPEPKGADVVSDASVLPLKDLPSFVPLEQKSNFQFLQNYDPLFFQMALVAEEMYKSDPNTTLMKLRQLGEALAQDIASKIGIKPYEYKDQYELIYQLDRKLSLSYQIRNIFHSLRKDGNKAVHEFSTSHQEAVKALRNAHSLALWYHGTFGENKTFTVEPFVLPSDPTEHLQQIHSSYEQLKARLLEQREKLEESHELAQLKAQEQKEYGELISRMKEDKTHHQTLLSQQEKEYEEQIKAFEKKIEQLSQAQITLEEQSELQQSFKRKAQEVAIKLHLSEDETREIIDQKLNDAGWEADTKQLDYRKGTRPELGRNMAIAEWECYNPITKKKTRADYVLFIGLKPVAVVEAKRFGDDVADDIRQAQEYSRDINLQPVLDIAQNEGISLTLDEWYIDENETESYRVPMVFSTNGREFQNQIKTKSGIWFRDLRRPQNRARALVQWFRPEEIEELLDRDDENLVKRVKENACGTLGLRDYQQDAVLHAEEAIVNNQRELLLAMATGTGKTRTIIALMYRLLKANYFKRILFLVDRGALGEQAENAFSEIRPEGNMTFDEIYDIKGLKDRVPDTKTRVHVATVQSMVKRVLASEELVPVGRYDCIVVDEAHRGYTLDRDMTEGEIELHDFRDYVSAYRQVLDYFDAIRIGLTATPATHTVEIFGRPVFTYSYREAVIDGWLIDSKPPYNFHTELSKNGIHFEKESAVDVVNVIGEVRQEILDDEMDFEVDTFNRKVLNDNFNEVICQKLVEDYLDPYSGEKTLIFCVSDIHADLVVEKMKEALAKEFPALPDNTVMKITGSIRDPRGAIREYKNEKFPNIAVTVDLLTTGVDVPTISNLVFLRRVRSRILYEQMKGRATRLCPDIDKDFFRIFDAVGLYKVLEKVDNMKPVVQDVSLSFEQLLDDLNNEKSYQHSGDTYGEEKTQTHAENVKEQLMVKLQMLIRRTKKIEKFPEAQEPLTLLNTLTKENLSCSFETLPQKFKEMNPKDVGAFFANNPNTLRFIDELREGLKLGATEMIISLHEDSFIGVERGYGEDAKGGEMVAPEDYLESFNTFIKENINKISALNVVVTRPRDLSRADLKMLQLELSKNYFSEKHLNTAWKNAKNEEIGATIIGFIRASALGSPLVSYKERVEGALKTIKASKPWNSKQEKWLELLAKQLIQNIIIDDEALQSSPFKERGGRKQLERIFEDRLDEVLDDFSDLMWA